MITSLPNALTIFRILCIPVLVALFFVDRPWAPWTAGGIFVIAAVTDFFDGYLARKMEVVSPLGKLLDPIADKLLVAATLLTLIAFDRIAGLTFIAALAILLREILISGLREFLAGMKAPGLPVSNLAKWKTGVQMTALGMLIVGDAAPAWWQVDPVGTVLLWTAAILTIITGWTYFQAGLKQAISPEPIVGSGPSTGPQDTGPRDGGLKDTGTNGDAAKAGDGRDARTRTADLV